MTFRYPRAIIALALFGFSATVSGAQSNAEERAAWNRPVLPFRIVGNIYYVGAAGVSAFLIATPNGLILLDGGMPETAAPIAANVAQLGFHLRDVKYLLNSHAHYDHAGGLAELKQRSGAKVVASNGDAPALRAGTGDMPALTIDRLIADGDTLNLGGVVLTAHVTPGHTRSCTTWTTTAAESGHTYRVLFYCSTTIVDRLVGNTTYPQIVADYERSFQKLRTLGADVFLTNHPGFMEMDAKRARITAAGPNPFVDAAELPRYVDKSEKAFRTELEKQRQQR